MFWDKAYQPSHNIEALLEKENVTVEEFLDEDDILQECKSQKKAIANYFTRPDVIKRLIELITTEPADDLPITQRFRHANMACEVLTVGVPSLDEKLLADGETLKLLYSYLEKEPPLNPLLSSFFSKTFSMLFTKKAEQDWFLYQQMCLQFLEYVKSQNNFLTLICKHFNTPVIPDLITQMMRDVEGGQLKRNLYEWLTEDRLVERLIEILANSEASENHANVAEFLCDLIQQGRTMRLTEQENDSFEPAFEGSNPILKTIESEATIEALLNVILEPNAQESAIVSGISVVLKLIKPVVFVEEANSDRMKFIHNREKEIHEQILNTVIPVISPRLKDFNEILRNPPKKPDIITTAATLSPPFGITRLQVCRVFAMLLQTRNQQISKAICETDFFETLLGLFRQYCWNNFLHSEVEKCIQFIFISQNNINNSIQGSTVVNDGSFGKTENMINESNFELNFLINSVLGMGNNDRFNMFDVNNLNKKNEDEQTTETNEVEIVGDAFKDNSKPAENVENESGNDLSKEKGDDANVSDENTSGEAQLAVETATEAAEELKEDLKKTEDKLSDNTQQQQEDAMETNEEPKSDDDATYEIAQNTSATEVKEQTNENDSVKVPTDAAPTALQTHVIVNCKLISKFIECWKHNKEMETAERGRRLGYMGHLIKIFKHITNCISESEHIGALIENSLSDASELELWQSIVNPTDGDLTKALEIQSKMLAHDATEYSDHLIKNFLTDNNMWDYIASDSNKMQDASGNYIDDEDEDDENGDAGHSLFGKSCASTSALQAFGVTSNPWDNMDPFTDFNSLNTNSVSWTADFNADNFADFDSNFSTFANDMGESLEVESKQGSTDITTNENDLTASNEEYDNNANVEKSASTISKDEMTQRFADNLAKFENDDQNSFNEKAGAQMVRALHTLIHDSEDDYEDDEGMWTKPLGSSAAASAEPEESSEKKEQTAKEMMNAQNTEKAVISNGPSKELDLVSQKSLDNVELNNCDNSPTSEQTTNAETSLNNEDDNTAKNIKDVIPVKEINTTAASTTSPASS